MIIRKINIFLALCLLVSPAWGVKVADITRISGQRSNVLTGMGLVVGLKGTGDGGKFAPAIRPLVSMLRKFNNNVEAAELVNAQNVAVVMLQATVPPQGAVNGDELDVYVMTMGGAKSLEGGRLYVTPMLGPTGLLAPNGLPFALSSGPITIENTAVPTVGVVKRGAIMEWDMPAHTIDNGRFTLILEPVAANWTTASTIAKMINDAENTAGETLAIAHSETAIEVIIPPGERQYPDSFISRVQRLPVPILPTEARVVINEKTGTLIVTGDVEISPVAISHKGLTIQTITPTPVPSPRFPTVTLKQTVAVDTTGQGGAKLRDLVDALDQLKVPASERITIVKELYKSGKLHAKLIIE
ncbi:MAG: flagellar basal body P-ring protein FlgI [Phycisphaerales bacterium]|nr:flagellar basal body P-ring protein FlgI [Phycisphaerales bacterium]